MQILQVENNKNSAAYVHSERRSVIWHSVVDYLPADDVEVLCFIDPDFYVGYRYGPYGAWFRSDEGLLVSEYPTHWAFLPHAPG